MIIYTQGINNPPKSPPSLTAPAPMDQIAKAAISGFNSFL